MTTRNPLVRISGKIVDLPASDSIGGAPAGANGTNGINGGAITIGYTFDTTTTDADPGNGKLRLNNATQNTATTIYADLLDSLASDWTTALDTFDDSTNTVKGSIRLVKSGDATKFLTFNVTAVTTATGYRKITIANTASSTSSPFANGDSILLCFDRAGDKGADGAGSFVLLEQHSASASASLNFTTTISSTYDDYLIEIVSLVPATSGAAVNLLVSTDGGSTYATTSYQSVVYGAKISTGAYANAQSTTAIMLVNAFATGVTRAALSGSVFMHNPGSSLEKIFSGQVTFPLSTDSSWYGLSLAGIYSSASAVNAFQIKASSGNITSGTVRVYGLAK